MTRTWSAEARAESVTLLKIVYGPAQRPLRCRFSHFRGGRTATPTRAGFDFQHSMRLPISVLW